MALLTGVLAGPLLFLGLLEFNYVSSYVSCEMQQKWFLHAATVTTVLLIAGAGWRAWQAGAETLRQQQATGEGINFQIDHNWVGWLTLLAVLSAGSFVVLALALGVPGLVLPPCM